MNISRFILQLKDNRISFFTGVPDSQLKALCNYLINNYEISRNNIIAANEGNAVALAAGYHLSTGKIPCVYLQNSGLGNIINPVVSLLSDKVYGIPCVFVMGWRGEPNVHDQPQHAFQGEVTLKMLKLLDIAYMVIDKNTNENEIKNRMTEFGFLLDIGKSVAFVVKKDSLVYDEKVSYKNDYHMKREQVIEHIVKHCGEDIIVSTTGKISRELYEIRERTAQSHKYDFLTVGSMGHSSSIALTIALNTDKKVWCLDGDGAVLMHMGAMAVIGSKAPTNYIHVVLNNAAHESVGGIPTVCDRIDIKQIALACGYRRAVNVDDYCDLDIALVEAKKQNELYLLEIKIAIGSRDDLGRPTTTPLENKNKFMEYIKNTEINP